MALMVLDGGRTNKKEWRTESEKKLNNIKAVGKDDVTGGLLNGGVKLIIDLVWKLYMAFEYWSTRGLEVKGRYICKDDGGKL